MTAIILTTIFLLHAFFTSCDLIETKTTFVKECPKNENEQIQASTKLKCGVDEYNNSQYFCLPLVNKTSLVELCFNGGLGRWEEGNCLETDGEKIYSYNCSNFSSGCPEEDFFDYEFYIYPACLNISTEFHCYLFDPFCSTQLKTANEVKETKTHEVKETTTHEVKETTTHEVEETTHGPKNNTSKSFLGVLSVVVFVLVVIFVIGIFVLKRKYWGNKDSGVNEMNGIDDQGTALLPQGVGTIPPAETQVDGSIQEPKTPNGDSLNQGMSTTNTQEEIISSNPETPLSDTSPRPFTPATPNEDGSIKASDTPNEAGPQPSTSESQITGGETTKSGSLNETNNDEVAGIKFAILFDDLADNFPEKKLQKLKDLIQSSKKVNNIESLNKARSARDCFRILNSENHFTESDVLFVQFLLRRTGCKKLNHNCEEYAKEQRALGFYEKQTENGYIHVYFHVTGDLSNFSKEKRRKVKEIVAAMVGSKTDQVYFDGYRRLESFLAIVSIETIYVGKLVAINKKDRYRFVDLDIDYFLVDFMKVILKISQESQRVDYHEHDKKTEQHTIIQPRERTFVPSSTFEVDICTGILHKIADEESMETSLKSQDVAYHEPVQKTEHTIIPPHKSRFVPSKVRGETSLGFLHKMEYEESMETSLKSQDVAYHEPVQKTEHKIKTLHERHFVPYKVIPKKTHGFLHTMADETEMEKLLELPFSKPFEYNAHLRSSIRVSKCRIKHISCFKPNRLWLSTAKTIQEIDEDGHLLRELSVDLTHAGNHTLSKAGDLLFKKDNDIYMLSSSGEIRNLHTHAGKLSCIHCSRLNGDIFVSEEELITRFNDKGVKLQTIALWETLLFIKRVNHKRNCNITENINGDIVTIVGNHVVAFKSDGQYKFNLPKLHPSGLCNDNFGHILVGDLYHQIVHLLDIHGNHLAKLPMHNPHPGLKFNALCVDEKNNLYVGCKNKIDVYTYLSDTTVTEHDATVFVPEISCDM